MSVRTTTRAFDGPRAPNRGWRIEQDHDRIARFFSRAKWAVLVHGPLTAECTARTYSTGFIVDRCAGQICIYAFASLSMRTRPAEKLMKPTETVYHPAAAVALACALIVTAVLAVVHPMVARPM